MEESIHPTGAELITEGAFVIIAQVTHEDKTQELVPSPILKDLEDAKCFSEKLTKRIIREANPNVLNLGVFQLTKV